MRESASKALGCLGQDGLDAMLQLGGLEAEHPEASTVVGACAKCWGPLAAFSSLLEDMNQQQNQSLEICWNGRFKAFVR